MVPHRKIWSWYTGRWWVGCYIWYSDEGTGRSRSPHRALLAVPAHPSTASVPITVLLSVALRFYKGLKVRCGHNTEWSWTHRTVTTSGVSTTTKVHEARSGCDCCDFDLALTCTVWTLGRRPRCMLRTLSSTLLRRLPTVFMPRHSLVFPSTPAVRIVDHRRASSGYGKQVSLDLCS